MIYAIGDIIAFSYSSEPRQGVRDVKASKSRTQSGQTKWATEKERRAEQERLERETQAIRSAEKKQQKEEIHDKYPQVLVLHNSWAGKVHGINLNQMSQQEINYLTALVDPFFAAEIIKKDGRIKAELQRLPKDLQISSPHDFYMRVIKPFIKLYDGYRLYNPSKMFNVKVVKSYKDIQRRAGAAPQQPGQEKQTGASAATTKPGGSFFSAYAKTLSRMRGPRF